MPVAFCFFRSLAALSAVLCAMLLSGQVNAEDYQEAPSTLNLVNSGPQEKSASGTESIASDVDVVLLNLQTLLGMVRLEGEQEVLLLSLDECIALAMNQNPGVLIASINPEIAEDRIVAARGDFDPRLSASIESASSENTVAQGLSLDKIAQGTVSWGSDEAKSKTLVLESGINGKLATGLAYNLSVTQTKSDQNVNAFGGNNSTEEERIKIALTQPLLRGAGIRINLAEIRKAEAGLSISDAELYLLRQNMIADAIGTYWQLVGAYAVLQVRESAVRTAEQLLAETQQRNELGASSDLDVLTAQAAVARRQNDLIDGFVDIGFTSDRLKQILNLKEEDLLETAMLIPTSEPPEVNIDAFRYDEPLEVRIRAALERRPELQVKDAQQAIAGLSLRQRRNARYPALDFIAQYGYMRSDSNFSSFFVSDSSTDTDYWSLGLEASIPIGNRRARAEYRSAGRQVAQIQLERKEIQSLINEDVRRSIREMSKSIVLVENAQKTVSLEQVRFKAEQERFLFGDSTAFHLIQVQDDLILEETRLAQAKAQLLAAQADMQRAEGKLLADLGLDVDPNAVKDPLTGDAD